MSKQDKDKDLSTKFSGIADKLADSEQTILEELLAAQGGPVSVGGYYSPDPALADKAMRPSPTLNEIVSGA